MGGRFKQLLDDLASEHIALQERCVLLEKVALSSRSASRWDSLDTPLDKQECPLFDGHLTSDTADGGSGSCSPGGPELSSGENPPSPRLTSSKWNQSSQKTVSDMERTHSQTTRFGHPLWEIRTVWKEDGQGTCSMMQQNTSGDDISEPDSFQRQCTSLTVTMRAGDCIRDNTLLQMLVCMPTSQTRLAWEFIGLVAITWDLFWLPYQAFETHTTVTERAHLITSIFWSLDLISNFFLGYYRASVVEMRPAKVSRRYLKTWFTLDFILVSTDWCLMAIERLTEDWIVPMFLFGRLARLMRLFRLLRLVRGARFWNEMRPFDRFITTEDARSLTGIIKLLIGVLVLTHFVACSWYAIGKMQMESGEPTWVKSLMVREQLAGDQSSVVYFYATAFHWSMTQFTPGSMEVVPCNTIERAFAVLTLLSGLILFSSLVSSITTAMTALRGRNFERTQQCLMVNRYLSERRVSLRLGSRITAFLRTHGYMPQQRALREQDISALGRLPEIMLQDLHYETYKLVLTKHALFRRISRNELSCFSSLCHLAVSQELLVNGQVLFRCGELASKMYFVSQGECEYYLGVSESEPALLEPPAFLCEAVLWMVWEHRGRLTASSYCELVSIDAQKFQEIVAVGTQKMAGFRYYSRLYWDTLFPGGRASQTYEDVTELNLNAEEVDEMVIKAFPDESHNAGLSRTSKW
eukprot:CAMPEP_0170593628 /NCGR_PEP_ID=MMETSP0224-20130122/13558_1 /TAXON_ID=285029 /ORGANISM="Togula jolla, Strain CCCM 725" /LENGTH=693 /DNA_ID=CAMNT_0010917611 /DNA_START=41 /DNA_END=2119 /DNA_ORIENTATION=+